MKLETAEGMARCLVRNLRPYCDRIAIAGSIRRKKPQVGDIEIVCIPRQVKIGLFLDETVRDPAFIQQVNKWQKVKGEPTGKYTQRIIRFDSYPIDIRERMTAAYEINLDLFMTNAFSWGLIFAIRTGSATFSHQILARRWVQLGYNSRGGILRKGNEDIPVREEKDLFELLGLSWTDPECRE